MRLYSTAVIRTAQSRATQGMSAKEIRRFGEHVMNTGGTQYSPVLHDPLIKGLRLFGAFGKRLANILTGFR